MLSLMTIHSSHLTPDPPGTPLTVPPPPCPPALPRSPAVLLFCIAGYQKGLLGLESCTSLTRRICTTGLPVSPPQCRAAQQWTLVLLFFFCLALTPLQILRLKTGLVHIASRSCTCLQHLCLLQSKQESHPLLDCHDGRGVMSCSLCLVQQFCSQ